MSLSSYTPTPRTCDQDTSSHPAAERVLIKIIGLIRIYVVSATT